MPVDVRLLVAEAFIIELRGIEQVGESSPHREKLIQQLVRLAARHQMQFGDMILRENDAIAAIELRIAQYKPASRQFRDPIGKTATADPRNHSANSAILARIGLIRGHQVTSGVTWTTLILA